MCKVPDLNFLFWQYLCTLWCKLIRFYFFGAKAFLTRPFSLPLTAFGLCKAPSKESSALQESLGGEKSFLCFDSTPGWYMSYFVGGQSFSWSQHRKFYFSYYQVRKEIQSIVLWGPLVKKKVILCDRFFIRSFLTMLVPCVSTTKRFFRLCVTKCPYTRQLQISIARILPWICRMKAPWTGVKPAISLQKIEVLQALL